MVEGACPEEWMARERAVTERTDERGRKWRKAYFGGGAHFRGWLQQFLEIYGPENVKVEEVESTGLACYERAGEKMYRIWTRVRAEE